MRRRIFLIGGLTLLGLVAGGGYAVLTTPERREARLRAELEADMRRERERPVGTRVPSGLAVEGEVYAAIDSVLWMIPTSTTPWQARKSDRTASAAWDRIRPFVAPLRSAVGCTRIAGSFDAEAVVEDWRRHHRDETPKLEAFSEVCRDYASLARRLLELGSADEAADLLCDLWELAHLLAGRSSLDALGRYLEEIEPVCQSLVERSIERLDDTDLEKLDRRLGLLDADPPSFSEATNRDRLVLGIALRSRGLTRFSERPVKHGRFDSWHLVQNWKRTNDSEAVERLYRRVVEASVLVEPWRARAAIKGLSDEDFELWGLTRWTLSCDGNHNGPSHADSEGLEVLFDEFLTDRATLRIARVLVCARRYLSVNGRWPVSHAEALGRAPESVERDPFSGEPLRLEVDPDGKLRVHTAHFDTENSIGTIHNPGITLWIRPPRRP